MRNGQGLFTILKKSDSLAFNEGKGFVELLVNNFPRFKDEYLYKNQKIGIYKLAQLAVMALQSALSQFEEFRSFKDCDNLTLCADYQLPRSLRFLGILEYGSELKDCVDQEKLIPFGSFIEIELRMATIYAGWQLKKVMNQFCSQKGLQQITSQEIDFMLWNQGRQLNRNTDKHHLTRTIMY